MTVETQTGSVDLLPRECTVYVAGDRGLVGSAIKRLLRTEGFTDVIGRTSTELDLRDCAAVRAFIRQVQPYVIIDAAAHVGGILANSSYPADFISDNLRIQVNLLDAARESRVPRFLFLGSSCIYPKFAHQPIREESLLTGSLEPSNDAYAIAKIAGIMQVQAIRRQDGLPYISAMPTNLYGPGDNFHPLYSHVLPAMIRRFHSARESGARTVTCWGSGTPRREFLHVDDLASACLHLLENYDDPMTINVGTGIDNTIAEVAEMVADAVGYQGEIRWDTARPDGTPQKLLDVSRLTQSGWKATIPLADGLATTYQWFLDQHDQFRR